jgi:hypothetical protein
VRSWKSDVLPAEGNPMRPARNIGTNQSIAASTADHLR